MQHHSDTDLFQLATDFVNNTKKHLFITGKAGTGKTTFLKQIQSNTLKNSVVVAPTGVAAINAGGTTIHSFFQLPFGPYLPLPHHNLENDEEATDKHALLGKLKLNRERRNMMRMMDVLIVDEISMVRCDVLDAMDAVLRHVRSRYHQPFGGVQVIYIGDLYQLPPVVPNHEWDILQTQYASPFFFDSKVIKESIPLIIEFNKVFRQSDAHFLDVLNNLRHNTITRENYELLQQRKMGQGDRLEEGVITLTTHNNKANRINEEKLAALPGKEYVFPATVSGEFYEANYPAELNLKLKLGCQVMFIKNDVSPAKLYFNGKIGLVTHIDDETIEVTSQGQLINVQRSDWKSMKYALNAASGVIEEEEVGTFVQYPLRLAWAITIHKSQGLTFDKVAIDAIHSFSPGQVYVALSRCRTLEGIYLTSDVSPSQMQTPPVIANYMEGQASARVLPGILQQGVQEFQQTEIEEIFSFGSIQSDYSRAEYLLKQIGQTESLEGWSAEMRLAIDKIKSTADKFRAQFPAFYSQEFFPFENQAFVNRLHDAVKWFCHALDDLQTRLKKVPVVTDNREKGAAAEAAIEKLFNGIRYKSQLLKTITQSLSAEAIYKFKREFKHQHSGIKLNAVQKANLDTDILHPDLYKAILNWRSKICEEKNIDVYMVCTAGAAKTIANELPHNGQLLKRVRGFGQVKVRQFGDAILDLVNDYIDLHGLERSVGAGLSQKQVLSKRPEKPKKPKEDTRAVSYELFKTGKTVDEIAAVRGFTTATIAGHLNRYVEAGDLSLEKILSAEKLEKIREFISSADYDLNYSNIRDHLPPGITVYEVQWVLAAEK